jgi:hypothetical protein
VYQVIGGKRAFAAEVDVAAVAVAQRPLIAVLVAPKAGGHRRQQRLRMRFGHLNMATHAVAVRSDDVLAVLEAQVLLRELDSASHERLAVAAAARALVVRLRVTSPTIRIRRKMERAQVASTRDARVTRDAVDSPVDVRAVLEWMRRRSSM